MNNDPCVKCKKPLNGGVYRKPNLCPHCFSIQDQTLTAKGKPLRGKKAKVQNVPVTPAVAAIVSPTSAPIATEENIETVVDQLFESEVSEAEVSTLEEVAEASIFDEEDVPLETEDDYLVEYSARIEPTINAEEEKTQIMPPRKATPVKGAQTKEQSIPKLTEEIVEFSAKQKTSAADIDLDNIQSPTIFDEPENTYDYERSEDEELYDDFSGIDDDMLIDDEVGLTEENSESLVALTPAAQESFKQEIKESLDIKLKLVPSAAEESDVAVAETASRKAAAQANSGYESVVLTAETARDIEVEKYLDIVTAECVFETNMVRSDFPRQGRSGSRSMSVVQDARKTVLDTIKQDAYRLGANTVIGLNIEYSEFTRGNQPMMMVVATGTAIRTSKEAVA